MKCQDCQTDKDTLTDVGGRLVCERCLEGYNQCDWCGAWSKDDLYDALDQKGEDIMVCERCLKNNFSFCEGCEQNRPDDLVEDTRDGLRCQDCLDDYSPCADCGIYTHFEDLVTTSRNEEVCPDCAATHYTECDECHTFYPNDETVFVQSGHHCQKCAQNKNQLADEPRPPQEETMVTQNTQKMVDSLAQQLRQESEIGSLIKYGSTNEIILPPGSDLMQIAKTLVDFHKSQMEVIQTRAEFPGYHPNDALVNFVRAVEKTYGKLMETSAESRFGSTPGRKMNVAVSASETVQVPVGKTIIPNLEIIVHLVYDLDPDNPLASPFFVVFEHQRIHESLVTGIIADARRQLAQHSIFKGKAIDDQYNFVNLANVNPAEIVYHAETRKELEAELWGGIRFTQAYREMGLPLNQKIMLTGGYGTGKTETARLTGLICVENGWTYINVRPDGDLVRAIQMARQLQPAVVFEEDIDALTGGSRTRDMNEILNEIDGVLGKDDEVKIVFSTNHPERIENAMRRPGRSRRIPLRPLDQDATRQLILVRLNKGETQFKYTPDSFDWDKVYAASQGYSPVFIVTGVDAAKQYNLTRNGGRLTKLTTEDLVHALAGLREQFEYCEDQQVIKPPVLDTVLSETIAKQVAQVIASQVEPALKNIEEKVS